MKGAVREFSEDEKEKRIGKEVAKDEADVNKDADDLIDQLAMKAASGDKASLKQLLELPEFQDRLKIICEFVASRYKTNPDDLIQEANVKIARVIDQFKAEGSFKAWASKVVRNLQIDLLRKQNCQRKYVKAQARSIGTEGCYEYTTEEREIDRITLSRAISKLSVMDSRILELRLMGYNIKEISMRVGLSTAQTHRRLKRVLQMLEDVVSSDSST